VSSPIRELLADAQAAEVRGDKADAARLLRRAAAMYRDANNHTRALKMLRHARRLEGVDEDQPGDPLEEPGTAPEPTRGQADLLGGDPDDTLSERPERQAVPRRQRRELEERMATLAPPALDAWCSFCCRPRAEVGTLVAGPAGAFICQSCLGTAEALLAGSPAPKVQPSRSTPRVSSFVETTGALKAKKRLESRTGRVTLLVGPEGSGKSAVLAAVEDEGLERIDLSGPVTPQRESELLSLMERGARLVIALRAEAPKPALVLQGADGEEPLYDTQGLTAALGGVLPRALLTSVDGVVVLAAPDADALEALAVGLVATRGDLTLSQPMLKQIAALAEKSGRGAHELVALIARVPQGSWK
jgi:ClpX C4-type zinc finger